MSTSRIINEIIKIRDSYEHCAIILHKCTEKGHERNKTRIDGTVYKDPEF